MRSLHFEKLTPFGSEAFGFSPECFDTEMIPEAKAIAKAITRAIKEKLIQESLVLIRNVSLKNSDELIQFAARLSSNKGSLKEKLLHWEFGPVMQMAFDPDAKNYLFSDERVPFHWDGAFHREPRYLVFLCLESEGSGGETLITNTEKLYRSMNDQEKASARSIRLRFTTEKKAHYGGQIDVPLLQVHPEKGTPVLRFAEEVTTRLNPVERQTAGSDEDADLLVVELSRKIYAPEFCYVHRWQKGDLLIVDNFSNIHGRNSLGSNRRRAFSRIQVL